MRHSLFELFHLSNLLQVLSGHRMVDVGFFGNFLCPCKRISFKDGSHSAVPVGFRWLAATLLSVKAHVKARVSLDAEPPDPPLRCMFISSSWAKCELSPLLYNPL